MELSSCRTNDAVDVVNKKNLMPSNTQNTRRLSGLITPKLIMYVGLTLMAYKTHSGNTFGGREDVNHVKQGGSHWFTPRGVLYIPCSSDPGGGT